jgi:hypothetical protein
VNREHVGSGGGLQTLTGRPTRGITSMTSGTVATPPTGTTSSPFPRDLHQDLFGLYNQCYAGGSPWNRPGVDHPYVK